MNKRMEVPCRSILFTKKKKEITKKKQENWRALVFRRFVVIFSGKNCNNNYRTEQAKSNKTKKKTHNKMLKTLIDNNDSNRDFPSTSHRFFLRNGQQQQPVNHCNISKSNKKIDELLKKSNCERRSTRRNNSKSNSKKNEERNVLQHKKTKWLKEKQR